MKTAPHLWRRVTANRWERPGVRGKGRASVWRDGGHWHGHAVLHGRIVPLITRRGHNRRFRSALHAIREVGATFPFPAAPEGGADRSDRPEPKEAK